MASRLPRWSIPTIRPTGRPREAVIRVPPPRRPGRRPWSRIEAVGPADEPAPAHRPVLEVVEEVLDHPRRHARLFAEVGGLGLRERGGVQVETAVLEAGLAARSRGGRAARSRRTRPRRADAVDRRRDTRCGRRPARPALLTMRLMATTGDSASTASLRHTRGEDGTIRASLIFTVVASSSTRRRRLPRSNVAAPSSGALTKVPASVLRHHDAVAHQERHRPARPSCG